MRRVILLLCLLLAACVPRGPAPRIALPPLRLPPSALEQPIAAQQRLTFTFGSHRSELDALLEADRDELRLAVQALGQTGVRLRWDGHALEQQRAPWLPPAVRGERVLDDLQFALWPAAAIRAVLPPDWRLQDDAGARRLEHDGQAWLILERLGPEHLRLHNLAEGYVLEIRSQMLGGPAP